MTDSIERPTITGDESLDDLARLLSSNLDGGPSHQPTYANKENHGASWVSYVRPTALLFLYVMITFRRMADANDRLERRLSAAEGRISAIEKLRELDKQGPQQGEEFVGVIESRERTFTLAELVGLREFFSGGES